MKKFIDFAIVFKPLMLMYFAGGVFVYMLFDLVFFKTGNLQTAIIWQILLVSALCATTQYVFYETGSLKNLSIKVKLLGHLAITFSIILALSILFKWVQPATFQNYLIFILIFIVAYLGLYVAFYIFYKGRKDQLNQQLEKYKKQLED